MAHYCKYCIYVDGTIINYYYYNAFHKVKSESFDHSFLYKAFLLHKVFVFEYYCEEYP